MSRRVVWNTDELVQKISPQVEKKIHSIKGGRLRIRSSKTLKKQTAAKSFIKYFHEFTANTSLHGLKYIGEQDRSLTERVWWAIMFALSLTTCAYLILNVWHKWQTIPVIVSFDEKPTPIWKMAFPAITVCSESKALQSDFNYTKFYHENDENMTSSEHENYNAISLLCTTEETGGNLTTDRSTIDIIKKLSPPFEFIINCLWQSNYEECSDMFQPVLTDEGLCHTFNMLDASEIFREEAMYENMTRVFSNAGGWNLHDGYAKGIPIETYPRRATGFGALKGLSIVLIVNNIDLDYICRGPVQGYRISLHTPSEIPRASQEFIRIPLGQEILVGIKPNMMTTSLGLKNYHPKKRHCYFPAERHLRYYKSYTKQNCDLECLSNYTLHVCGCVSFFMPRDSSMKICSTGSTVCVKNAEEELLIRGIQSEMAAVDEISDNESDGERKIRLAKEAVASHCDCLLACTSISYEAETSQVDFDWSKTFQAYESTQNSHVLKEMINFAKATIFFKQPEFIKSLRSELYGRTDFLANCGGLLGLCLGFSVLSLIEIVYFVTLRLVCNLTNRRKIKILTKKTQDDLTD